MSHLRQNNQGFALLLAIVVSSVLLAIGLSMLTITTKQLTLSSTARESEIAFQAAAAGMECVRFQRRNQASVYTTENANAPSITCFTETDTGGGAQSWVIDGDPDGFVNKFNYRLSWGSGSQSRCSELDLYVMVGETGTVRHNFQASDNITSFGLNSANNDGRKDCLNGDTCTVAVTRGYNKSCADVDAGLATVQRELTAQF